MPFLLVFCNVSWEEIGRVDFFFLFLKMPDILLVIWNLLSSFYITISFRWIYLVYTGKGFREKCANIQKHTESYCIPLLSPLSYRKFNVIARFRWIAWEFFVIRTNDAFSRDKRNASRRYVPFLARYTKIT